MKIAGGATNPCGGHTVQFCDISESLMERRAGGLPKAQGLRIQVRVVGPLRTNARDVFELTQMMPECQLF